MLQLKDAGANETESGVRHSAENMLVAGWKIHSSRNLIEKDGQSVRLQPRTMAVLTRLLESPGEVVTRQQLEDFAWPNMVVGYDALSHTITKLRKAFDDEAKNPRFIETIPRVGYRLVADVSRASPESGEIDIADESAAGRLQILKRIYKRRFYSVGILLVVVITGLAWWQPWETGKPLKPAAAAYLQGLSYYHRNTPADNARAEAHFKQAIELDPGFKIAYAALARVYYRGIDGDFGNALLLSFDKAMFLAHKNLSRSAGANSADEYILRARIALVRHQVDVALREAERALEISKNDVEAMTIRASALVFSGKYARGHNYIGQVAQYERQVTAEALYITGLSYFASGSYADTVEYIEQALDIDGAPGHYNLLLAAARGKLGMKIEAQDALLRFRETWNGPFWMTVAVAFFPFQDNEILVNLADGLEAAGVVERPPARYLELSREARLSGREIEALLFGHTIKGSEFLIGYGWSQKRTAGGKVAHQGTPIHIGTNPDGHNLNKGESWIDGDRLCNRWFDVDGHITSCALIFRDLKGDRNHYYMMTEYGPNRFQVTD